MCDRTLTEPRQVTSGLLFLLNLSQGALSCTPILINIWQIEFPVPVLSPKLPKVNGTEKMHKLMMAGDGRILWQAKP